MVPNSLTSPPVRSLLDRLFQAAEFDDARRASLAERYPDGFAALSAREQADASVTAGPTGALSRHVARSAHLAWRFGAVYGAHGAPEQHLVPVALGCRGDAVENPLNASDRTPPTVPIR